MMRLAWRLAWRDLRGGQRGLAIVLLCLGVGVAAVAGIGSLRAAVEAGISESGRAILGGDLDLSSGLGPIDPGVAAWARGRGAKVTQTLETRSILVAPGGRRLLAAVRAVGPGWPMLGRVETAPAGAFATLARGADGRPGLLLDPAAARSLGLRAGDGVSLGGVGFVFRGVILDSPDRLGDSQLFGAKTFVALGACAGTALEAPGGFATFDAQILAPGRARDFQASLRAAFPGAEFRVRDAAAAAPDVKRFVDQASLFMTLLGLAALLVGGIGVANGVEAWLTGRARTIATLRCLGASSRLVSAMLGMQLAVLGAPGILAGLAVGAAMPVAVLPWLRAEIPVPAHVGVYAGPLTLAAGFGVLVGVLFALGPLRRAAALSGAGLFRLAGLPARVAFSARAAAARLGLVLGLAGLAALSVPDPLLALGFCGGTVATLLLLRGVAAGLMRLLPLLPAPKDAALVFGLRRLHGPASSLPLMLLSAGAGLTVLVAVAEIRGNLVAEFNTALPAAAPSFYFIDIQPGDWPAFEAALAGTGAYDVRSRPAMRARILAVGGVPVEWFHPPEDSAWPLRSDIGFSFADAPPPGTKLAAGAWWGPNYLGAPEVSLDARIARAWGVGVGDRLTVAVLGQTFDLRIANLRDIDWQNLNIDFLMVGTPDPFAAAPHTLIATLRAPPGRDGDVLAAVTDALPGVTGIDVGQVLRAVGRLLGEVGTAVSAAGLVALLAGGLVLISAVAAEREARIAEAVVLKTLGASRAQIRRAWLFEFAIAGGIAGLVAAALGTLAAAVTVRRVFDAGWRFEPGICAGTVLLSVGMMMALGFVSTARALRAPAAARLRLESGG